MVKVTKRKIIAAYTPILSTWGIDISMAPLYEETTSEMEVGYLEQGKDRIAGECGVYHHHLTGDLTYVSDQQTISEPVTSSAPNRFWGGFRPPPENYLLHVDGSSTLIGNHFVPWEGQAIYTYTSPYGTSTSWVGIHRGFISVVFYNGVVDVCHWTQNKGAFRTYYDSISIMPTTLELLATINRWIQFLGLGPCLSPQQGGLAGIPVDVDLHSVGVPWLSVPSCDTGLPNTADYQRYWGSITQQAVDSASLLDINGLSFCKDLLEWKKLLPDIRSLKRLKRDPKAWANLYLYLRYGLSLTVKDSKEVYDKFVKPLMAMKFAPKKGYHRVRAGKNLILSDKKNASRVWNVSMRTRIIYDPWPGEYRWGWENLEALRSLDLYPTAENLWDLIPYSFVLDWFIPISDWLHHMDSELRLQTYTIHCVTNSLKFTSEAPLPPLAGFNCSGKLTEVYYSRSVSRSCDIGSFSWTNETNSGSPRRAIDAAALIAQRVR